MGRDMRQHAVKVGHYVRIGDPNKPEALASKPRRPLFVVCRLPRMRIAVHLNDQADLGAEKIGDEPSQPDLATEFQVEKLSTSKPVPQTLFGRRRGLSR